MDQAACGQERVLERAEAPCLVEPPAGEPPAERDEVRGVAALSGNACPPAPQPLQAVADLSVERLLTVVDGAA